MFGLSLKNILHKPLSSILSVLLLAMAVAVFSILLLLQRELSQQFNRNISGIDMVIGAKGSPLQLILSSIYQVDYPTGNINLADVQKWIKSPLVKQTIPLAYGDAYESYRIVGTELAYLDHFQADMAQGVKWDHKMEMVAGSKVAAALGLQIGDQVVSQHGLHEEGEAHSDQPYTVVGILKRNGSVLDQLLLTSVESVWQIHEHEDHGSSAHKHEHNHDHQHEHTHNHDDHHAHNHHHDHEVDREITALLVSFRNPMGMMSIPRRINKESVMQAALPSIEVSRLLGLMDSAIRLLKYLAVLLMVVSALSVFISLLNSLKDRKTELALLRTMGASPAKVFSMVLIESLLLTLIGFFLGWAFSRMAFWMVSMVVEGRFHYSFSSVLLLKEELFVLLLCILLGAAAALIPAIRAYRINISKTLSNA